LDGWATLRGRLAEQFLDLPALFFHLTQQDGCRLLAVGSVIKVVKQVIACYPPPVEMT
jgi:hypothetical protein